MNGLLFFFSPPLDTQCNAVTAHTVIVELTSEHADGGAGCVEGDWESGSADGVCPSHVDQLVWERCCKWLNEDMWTSARAVLRAKGKRLDYHFVCAACQETCMSMASAKAHQHAH
jgi:hypothetical protein